MGWLQPFRVSCLCVALILLPVACAGHRPSTPVVVKGDDHLTDAASPSPDVPVLRVTPEATRLMRAISSWSSTQVRAVTADGRYALVSHSGPGDGGGLGEVSVWDLRSLRQIFDGYYPFRPFAGPILSGDGKSLAVASSSSLHVTTLATGDHAMELPANALKDNQAGASFESLDFSPDNRRLLIGISSDREPIAVYDLATGKVTDRGGGRSRVFMPLGGSGARYAPDAQTIVAVADDFVTFWPPGATEPSTTECHCVENGESDADIGPDRRTSYYVMSSKVLIRDLTSHRETALLRSRYMPKHVVFLPNGRFAIFGHTVGRHWKNTLEIFDHNGKPLYHGLIPVSLIRGLLDDVTYDPAGFIFVTVYQGDDEPLEMRALSFS